MMHKKILIATDGSELSDKAVSYGLSVAKQLNSNVTLVTVSEVWQARDLVERHESGSQNPIEDYENIMTGWAERVLSAAADEAKKMGVNYETIHVKDQHPAEGIIETAKSKGSDLIIMASHGRRGLKMVLIGIVANEVVSESPVPVLIYR